MVVDFKYKDNKGKYQTVTKNLEPGCLEVEQVYIGNKHYYIEKRVLYINEPKIVVWLKE